MSALGEVVDAAGISSVDVLEDDGVRWVRAICSWGVFALWPRDDGGHAIVSWRSGDFTTGAGFSVQSSIAVIADHVTAINGAPSRVEVEDALRACREALTEEPVEVLR